MALRAPLALARVVIAQGLFLSMALHAQDSPLAPLPAPGAMLVSVDPVLHTFGLTSAEARVAFDIDGDGDLEQVAWTGPNAAVAFLVLDLNDDGRITSGKELVGSLMVPGAGNGPNALIEIFKATGAPLRGAVQRATRAVRPTLAMGGRELRRRQRARGTAVGQRGIHGDWIGLHTRESGGRAREPFPLCGLGAASHGRP